MNIIFLIEGQEVTLNPVGRERIMKSDYIHDIISLYGNNAEVYFPGEYLPVSNLYVDFLNGKKVIISDIHQLTMSFRLANFLLHNEYFSYLMTQAYRIWINFYPHIQHFSSDIQREIYLHTPYQYIPSSYMMDDVFFKQWLTVNQNKSITLNKIDQYHVSMTYGKYKVFTSSCTLNKVQNIRFTKRWYMAENQLEGEKQFLNRRREGLWRKWYMNGQLKSEHKYKDGLLMGPCRKWHNNGQLLRECTYINDKVEGVERYWFNSGHLYSESNFSRGQLNGYVKIFHLESQQIQEEGSYVEGRRMGIWKRYYGNGQLSSETSYHNGYAHGPYKSWYENGQIQYQGNVINGCRDGKWKTWNVGGFLIEERDYNSPFSTLLFQSLDFRSFLYFVLIIAFIHFTKVIDKFDDDYQSN